MKEDVIAANLANLRKSINELKESVDKLSNNSSQLVQSAVSPIDERTVYNSVAKSFCNCWNDALSILKKSVRKEQPDKIPLSKWIPKLIDLLKQKSSLIDYLYAHVCDCWNAPCSTVRPFSAPCLLNKSLGCSGGIICR